MILTLLACGPDLPEGWEDAERVDDFTQAECGDTGELALAAEAAGDDVALEVTHVGARCAQDLEAFWQPAGDAAAEVLIQPVDMTPASVAKCDCAYDLAMVVPTPAPVTLEVWERGDEHAEEDPQPYLLGTVEAE
ncbi:MAG: hypothetical protein ACOZNI_24550 [Myxococcota bacterium]